MTRLWLLDPGLVRNDGHRLPYAVDIAEAAKRRGMATTVVLSREADDEVLRILEAAGVGVEPLLIGGRAYSWGIRAWRPAQFLATVDRLTRRATPSDLMCVTSGEIEQVAGLLAYTRAVRHGPRIVIQMFDWGPAEGAPAAERAVLGVFRRVADALGRRRIPPRLIVAGQSTIAETLAARLGQPIAELPFVVDWDRFDQVEALERRKEDTRRTVAFLGGARFAKGFGHFVEAAVRDPARFRWIAQAFQNVGQEHPDLTSQIAALRGAGCEVHTRALAGGDYACLLLRADIVALPYSPRYYAQRTSGILAEALGLGKVVVAPRGTWLGGMLERVGAGVVYDDYSAAGLLEGLRRAEKQFDRLREFVERQASAWRERNSANGFVSELARLAGWPQP